jgi:fructose-bisphosphate aldolase class I
MNKATLLLLLAMVGPSVGFSVGGTFLSPAEKRALEETAAAVATPGKGITACDEGPGTIGARFEAVGVENTEENRRLYRQMLFEAEGCEEYLSAAILDPETLYQRSDSGLLFPEVLSKKGIVPGIKPHLKVYTLPGTNGDTVMQGLDSLAARCKEYYAAGARFAKWRSPLVIDVDKGCPTDLAIRANMHDLARYALICQSEGLMPIVEPDISLSGSHTLEEAVDVNIRVQSELFKAMSTSFFCVVVVDVSYAYSTQ